MSNMSAYLKAFLLALAFCRILLCLYIYYDSTYPNLKFGL